MPSLMSRLLLVPCVVWAVLGVSACTAPATNADNDPDFGQSVRAALRAQELPTLSPAPPAFANYMEMQQSLESHHKAKPVTSNTSRTSFTNLARPAGQ